MVTLRDRPIAYKTDANFDVQPNRMKRIAILQSNYLPWKGYFDLMAYVDEFIFYDEAQYTTQDWRNRNLIKTPHGLKWLSVPVKFEFEQRTPIASIDIDGDRWREQHWRSIQFNHARARHAACASDLLGPIYLGPSPTKLSELNRQSIAAIARFLGIRTPLVNSADYPSVKGDPTRRLVEICVQAGATHYVSGPTARSYLREPLFHAEGLAVEWFDYDGYPTYPQLWGDFEHRVSVIDVLFNCGPQSADFLRYTRRR